MGLVKILVGGFPTRTKTLSIRRPYPFFQKEKKSDKIHRMLKSKEASKRLLALGIFLMILGIGLHEYHMRRDGGGAIMPRVHSLMRFINRYPWSGPLVNANNITSL